VSRAASVTVQQAQRVQVSEGPANQLSLLARIETIQPLRYTPAGLPVLEMALHHESVVEQAGQPRQVAFALSAVAIGDIALLLNQKALGSTQQFTGFMAPLRKGTSRLVLHVLNASKACAGSGVQENTGTIR